jgi:hypothetical protein
MAATLYTELIKRAKAASDMHDGFPSAADWLYYLNAEYRKLWVRLIRSGYPPEVAYESIATTGASQYEITEPSAVIAVYGARQTGSTLQYYRIPIKRVWEQSKIREGAYPKECYIFSDFANGKLVVRFFPNPTSGTFFVVSVPKPKTVVSGTPGFDESNSVTLPFGWEERIVYGMAQRALTKEETVNPGIERELSAVDEQIDTHVSDYILQQSNTAVNVDDFPVASYLEWYYV